MPTTVWCAKSILPFMFGLAVISAAEAQELVVSTFGAPNSLAASGAAADLATTSISPDSRPTDLKFHEMFKLPVGPRGLEPTDKLLNLSGKAVRVVGYMVEQETMRTAILAPLPLKLGDEDEGLADDVPPSVIFIHFPPSDVAGIRYHPGLLELTGILSVGGMAEPDGRISLVRLTPNAVLSQESIGNVPR